MASVEEEPVRKDIYNAHNNSGDKLHVLYMMKLEKKMQSWNQVYWKSEKNFRAILTP